jgi:hypothetical protein
MLNHHAHLCRVHTPSPDSLKSYITSLNINEVYSFTINKFGKGDVRALIEKAYIKPAIGNKQLIVVYLNSITVEAQQALLKILEEPPSSTAFVFCVPTDLYLLPTLLSRFMEPSDLLLAESLVVDNSFSTFVAMSITDRFTEITAKLAAKDIEWIYQIKRGLLESLVKRKTTMTAKKLAWSFWLAEHLQTRGASNKMLLEELALTVE